MISVPGFEITELIHKSSHSSVYRAKRLMDKTRVVLKAADSEYPDPLKLIRFRREFEIVRNLDIDGAIKAHGLLKLKDTLAIIFEDFGGEALNRVSRKFPPKPEDILELALKIAGAIGQLHECNIIHKDINSSNILWNPNTGQIKLIDFEIASEFSREKARIKSPEVLEGTLSHISPEQTGRINRMVDYRTDLYSFGVTFYELLVGKLPFKARDPMELVYAHIARVPEPVQKINPGIAPEISAIVEKLMAKSPEERYQSIQGLISDLTFCLDRLRSGKILKGFKIAQKDLSDRLHLPQKLFGRKPEMDRIGRAIQVAREGAVRLLLVSGPPGVGKSSLIHELQSTLMADQGCFIAGKCDRWGSSAPYKSIIHAFKDLTRQLLSESRARLISWQTDLKRALGDSGQVLVDLIPDLELVIGKQPPLPSLPPAESQARFNLVFQTFIQVFTKRNPPLVLFLDDLQWADSATLKLIKLVLADPGANNLLFIGAFRDDEVDNLAPLEAVIEEIEAGDIVVERLKIEPLPETQVRELIEATFPGREGHTKSLSRLVHGKTNGNPFFVREFIKTLYQEKIIRFDLKKECWRWDMEELKKMGFSDNVVELLAQQVKKLPDDVRNLLMLSACVGNRFSSDTLSKVSGLSTTKTVETLLTAVARDLIIPVGESRVTDEGVTSVPNEELFSGKNIVFRFLHDRIHQAAYECMTPSQKQEFHLRLGRFFLARGSENTQGDYVFEIANHLNNSLDLITESVEREKLARVNLAAGKKAKASNAFESALSFLQVGLELLRQEHWTRAHELAVDLHMETAVCKYVTGDVKDAETRFETLLKNASSDLEKARIYNAKIIMYHHLGKYETAVDVGIEAAAMLGVKLPRRAGKKRILLEILKANLRLVNRPVRDLIHLPEMTDPKTLAAMDVLINMSTAVSTFDSNLLMYHIGRMFNLTLTRGICRQGPYIFAAWGILLCLGLQRYREGFEYGKLALSALEKYNDKDVACKTNFLFARGISHWRQYAGKNLRHHKTAFTTGVEAGNLLWSSWASLYLFVIPYITGDSLDNVIRQIDKHSLFIKRANYEDVAHFYVLTRQMALSLMGKTRSLGELSDDAFEEIPYVEKMIRECKLPFSVVWYQIMKAQACYLAGLFADASNWAERALESIDEVKGTLAVPEHCYYHALCLAAQYPDVSDQEKRIIVRTLKGHLKKLKRWAENCAENFAHKYLLIKAEFNRILNKKQSAADLYDQAIRSASQNGFTQNMAIANECAGKFYLEQGKEKIAEIYFTDAYYGYHLWGAKGKIFRMEHQLSGFLRLKSGGRADGYLVDLKTSTGGSSKTLDWKSMLKASQAISGEIVLASLLKKMLMIMMENAGAQRGLFLMSEQDALKVEAEYTIDNNRFTMLDTRSVDNYPGLPQSLLYYVLRKREPTILQDASEKNLFSSDPYFRNNDIRSVLCMPIINQNRLMGMLYLENNLAVGTFTPQRVQLLRMLSAQAAISVQNAGLFSRLADSEKKYRSIFENSTEGIFQTAPDGKLLIANPALASILGFASPEELLEFFTDRDRHPYVDQKDKEIIQEQLLSKGSISNHETRFFRKDGSIIDVSINGWAIRDKSGELLYFEGNLEDITEKKTAEKLKIEKEAAIASMHAKSRFLASMSHEIRTPLNAVIGLLNLLGKTKLTAKQLDYLGKIKAASNSLLGIINDILDFSKIEAGKLRLETVDFHLHEVLGAQADLFAAKIAEKNIDLLIHVDDDVPDEMNGDPLRLGQILMNLTDNAIKFTNRGQVLLHVALGEIKEKKMLLRFTVRDTGIGISREKISGLFTYFKQAETSIARKYGGSGLGLRICRHLVQLMRGDIKIESEEGVGTAFIFKVEMNRVPSPPKPLPELISPLKGFNLMVVDENRSSNEYLENLFSNAGLFCRSYTSAKKALEKITSASQDPARPDLIFVKYRLADMDSIEFVKSVKQFWAGHHRRNHPDEPEPRILMAITFGNEKVPEEAEKAGVDDFLTIPFTKYYLANIIMRMFGYPPPYKTEKTENKLGQKKYREKLKGTKILLVEDNEINQQVAREILEAEGMMVQVAQNGAEALEAVKKSTFDAILMDVQMPVMDGYEATSEIRKVSGLENIPIIAMTAHAMHGYEKKCISAGMNAFVSKPIDVSTLFSKLAFHLFSDTCVASAPEPEKVSDPEDQNGAKTPCLPGIDLDNALKRMNYNRELFFALVSQFAENYEEVVEKAQSLYNSGDIFNLQKLVHTLKGAAAALSANELHRAAGRLETCLDSQGNHPEPSREPFEKFRRELEKVLASAKTVKENKL